MLYAIVKLISIAGIRTFFNRISSQNLDQIPKQGAICLLYTSDAADERSSVDLGGRRLI